MSLDLRYHKRPTRKLSEVTDCDLLTAEEQYIKKQIGGYYSIGDESAYFRVAGEKPTVTTTEFERMIKKIHPHFFLIFNPTISSKTQVEGHGIAFYVPEFQGFVPLSRVGRSGSNIITANSIGSKIKYIGKKSLKEKEKTIISRGYIAAIEFCKQFLYDAKIAGKINANRCIKGSDYMVMNKLESSLGGKEVIERVFKEARILAESELDKMIEASKQKEKAIADLTLKAAEEYCAMPDETSIV